MRKRHQIFLKAHAIVLFTVLGALSSYFFTGKVKAAADLSYEQRKGFSSARVYPGAVLDLAFAVENKLLINDKFPAEDADNVTAEIKLPKYLDLVWDRAQDCHTKAGTTDTVVCEFTGIKTNTKKYKNLSFKVKEDPLSCGKDMQFHVKIGSKVLDPNISNNVSQTYKVSTVCADHKLYIPTAQLDQVNFDEKFYYSIVVSNESNITNPLSNDNAYAVSTETYLPQGLEFLSSSMDEETKVAHCNYLSEKNNAIVCNFNKLSNGETKSRRDLLLKVSDSNLCDKNISVTTKVNSRSYDPNPHNSSNTHNFKVSCEGEAMIAYLIPLDY